ncbi:hypothetical protein HDU96_006799 [Phlyctochytrium bullatum]|nr:hypothetical protein HDU96_006799 [Phlyctochytrium bullatum]
MATKLLDDATLELIQEVKVQEDSIVEHIHLDRKDIEFKYQHAERLNNWKTDELYIVRSEETEAEFIAKLRDDEYKKFLDRQGEEFNEQMAIEVDRKTFGQIMGDIKDLKLQFLHNRATNDMRASAKKTNVLRGSKFVKNVNAGALQAHARKIKQIKYNRNIVIRAIEDKELRILAAGHEFNDKTLAAENAKIKALEAEETRAMDAKIFSMLVRNNKEIEQLREVHLLKLKHTTKYCDLELEFMDEHESLLATHTSTEQLLESRLKAAADAQEAAVQSDMTVARVKAAQAEAAQQSAAQHAQHRRDAQRVKRVQTREAKERARLFWAEEEGRLREYLTDTYGDCDEKMFKEKAALLLDRSRIAESDKEEEEKVEDEEEEDHYAEILMENAQKMAETAVEMDRQFAREIFKIDTLRKQHKSQVHKLREQNRKFRDTVKKGHSKALKELLVEQDIDLQKLLAQQAKEMEALIETQQATEKVDEDNRTLNDRLNAMLPVLPTAEDRDAYCTVAGLNSQDRTTRLNAIDVIECALSFVDIVTNLDMWDQVKDKIEIRLGIHTGPATGGVANMSMPKFSLFGDAVTTTTLLEQTSKPNRIHVSAPAYELVKDLYDFDPSDPVVITLADGSHKKVHTYWLVGRKSVGKVDGKGIGPKGARTLKFEQ